MFHKHCVSVLAQFLGKFHKGRNSFHMFKEHDVTGCCTDSLVELLLNPTPFWRPRYTCFPYMGIDFTPWNIQIAQCEHFNVKFFGKLLIQVVYSVLSTSLRGKYPVSGESKKLLAGGGCVFRCVHDTTNVLHRFFPCDVGDFLSCSQAPHFGLFRVCSRIPKTFR